MKKESMDKANKRLDDEAKVLAELDLARQYREGNENALPALLGKLGIYDDSGQIRCNEGNFVYQFFRQRWLTRNEAEDFVEELVARLTGALKRFEYKATVRTFIYKICLNIYREQYKKRRREDAKKIYLLHLFSDKTSEAEEGAASAGIFEALWNAEPDPSILETIITEERKDIVRKCLARMNNMNWRLVASLRLEGLTFKQIAKQIGKTLGTVNGWWARAFASLKKCAKDLETGEKVYALCP
jgi:RNA polymerase sigma-70 factor (ECF subfamily)